MGLYARPSATAVRDACAPLIGSADVVGYVLGKTINERLLYVVTDREVSVLRLGRGFGLNPKVVLGTWPRGEVETEDGIASVRVGPYRAKVRFSERARAAEVARLAAAPA